ncbi:MAG: hypothetical protein OEV32_05380, partial [Gammaproteobacteria bacterium]|nr:hypothetical protein [Gammaproteobacteria bacterium]
HRQQHGQRDCRAQNSGDENDAPDFARHGLPFGGQTVRIVSDLAKKTSCLFAHSQTPGCAFCDINPSNSAE